MVNDLFRGVEAQVDHHAGHGELLDKLGGGAWQAKKAKLKERIREMADRLIRVAAERALRRAPILEAPGGEWEGADGPGTLGALARSMCSSQQL